MPDYMYLLESRLSPEQRAVLERVQELSRSQEVNVYLTGGAVRDLISGMPIRDLDFTLEGNPVRMVKELEKGGARVVWESEKLRHHEMIFAGDVDGSISGAREDVYERPGVKPEYRFSSVMEDLRRRDFGVNAIAISLNTQSRGLLLDPMNGLADLEKQEIRSLSIHAFTNQPIRLMRILRYCARMGFKMEPRTPDYDSLNKMGKIRSNLYSGGLRPRLQHAVTFYTLGRLKPREEAAALRTMQFRSADIEAVADLVPEAQKVVKILKGRKTNTPKDAYFYIASLPAEMLVFIEVEMPNPRVISKFRNYIQKWRPLRQSLPQAELAALGVARGPKFDKVIEQLFEMQLRGKGKLPEDRTKILRNLAGIKDEPKKIEKPEKKRKGEKGEEKGVEADAKGTGKPKQTAAQAPTVAKSAVSAAKGQQGTAKQPQSAAAAIGARAQAKHAEAAHKSKASTAGKKHAPSRQAKSKAHGTRKSGR